MALPEGLLAKAGEGFFKELYGAAKDRAVKKWQAFNWYTAQGWYYQKIEKDYGTTRILGKHEPIPLEGIFTDVFLLDKPTAFRRFDILKLQGDPDSITLEQKPQSGLDLVKKGKLHRLYILGKPGAGKTTFLKYVALKASQSEIRKIPIFVSLKEWADSDLELMPFLVKQFDICCFPESQPLIEYILELGLAIVLFDGLDETQQEGGKRDKIINDIRDFSRKYDTSQILITCRIAATDYTFEEFSYLEVADFTEQQVNRYVEKWFAYDEEKLNLFKEEFARDENERLREMASTPLLLSLLCLNFEQTGYFPQRRVEIYEEGINALLTRWDASRNIRRDEIYKGLELGRKRQMFARIAAQTFANNEYFLPKRKLVKLVVDYLSQLPHSLAKEDIDGEQVLKSIEAQHSIFVERAQDIYSFSHLSFQEYFTSKHIVDNAAKGTLKQLLNSKKITDNRWREVILNTASLLDEADSFFDIMQDSINSIIRGETELNKLLHWAKFKAESSNNKSLKDRIFYLTINNYAYFSSGILMLEEVKEKQDTNFPGRYEDLDTLTILTRVLFERGVIRFSAPSINRRIFLNSIENKHLDTQLVFFYILTRGFWGYLSEDIKRKHSYLTDFYKITLENVKNIDKEFFNALRKLKFPNSEGTKVDWMSFSENFLLLSQKYRNIPYIGNFGERKNLVVSHYFEATELLFDCLKLAVVSNRQNIENSLLLPTN